MNEKSQAPLRCGLLGEHLTHSYSPEIHEALTGGAYTYSLFERSPDELAIFLKGNEWDALNVTIPYKQAVMPYLDEISAQAQRIGAVNTITRLPDGQLRGDNTDYFGFARTVRASGVDVNGCKTLVLGNGGAAATAATVLQDMGAKVVVLAKRGTPVAGVTPEPFEAAYDRHTDATVVVNCTPVGMYPRSVGESLLTLSRLPSIHATFDMVYNPARTALLQEAMELSIPAYNGLLMLVAQAKRAAELFLGSELSDEMIDTVVRHMERQMGNILLIGMPGCGKSTVASLLAKRLGRRLFDTDSMVVEATGRSIPDIFATDGEEAFRAFETDAVRTCGMESGAVIATGGGVVTQRRNYAPLSQNGKLVFIHRDLDKLATGGRPLSQANKLKDMYAYRLPLYRTFADVEVDNNGAPDETIDAILHALGYMEAEGRNT